MSRGNRGRERHPKKTVVVCLPLRWTMPCSCSTRPPTDTEVRPTDPSPPRLSLLSVRLLLVLLAFRCILSIPPPRASFLWAELEETNGASLISQSVNLDQDKASLSTSSPPWD